MASQDLGHKWDTRGRELEGAEQANIARREGLTRARVTQFIRILRLAQPFFRGIPFNHRTNTDPKLGQTATRVSDGSRCGRLVGRIIIEINRECVRQPVEGRGEQEDTMRAVMVYRREDGSNSTYPARQPIGSVVELRIDERVNNYNDLLRLARRLFALDTADSIHLLIDLIDVDQDRKAA